MSTVKLFDEGGPADLFSYAALTREDEAAAREDAAIIKAHTRSAAESIIEVGLALKRQKERLPHGMFLPWIKAEFGMSLRTAQSMMNVAETFADKSASLAHLGTEALYLLAAPSTPDSVRTEVETRAAAGKSTTAAEVKRLKAEAKAAQERIDTLEERNAELARKVGKPALAPVVDVEAIRAEAAAEVEARLQARIRELEAKAAVKSERLSDLVEAADLFSYAALTREDEAAARIKLRLRRSAEDIIEIGLDLLAVKESLPHGAFLPWIETEFAMSDQTARRFMNVARVYGGKSNTVLDLEPKALYELAAPKTPIEVREEVEKLIAAGEVVTAATVKELRTELELSRKSAANLAERNEVLSRKKGKPAPVADEAAIRAGARRSLHQIGKPFRY